MYLCRNGKMKHEERNEMKWNSNELENLIYLGEINVEEEGLLGVGDLNAILLVGIGDVDVVHSLCYGFHSSLFLSHSHTRAMMLTTKNPNDFSIKCDSEMKKSRVLLSPSHGPGPNLIFTKLNHTGPSPCSLETFSLHHTNFSLHPIYH